MYPDAGGVRLTSAAIGALLKYPWTTTPQRKKKFNVYQTGFTFIRRVADELGLIESGNCWVRHPLSPT